MKHEHPAFGQTWERVRDAVHIDSDPTPAHGITRPLTTNALADALGWLDAQDAEYIEDIGNGDIFATLREALEIVEAFRLLYFANDYNGVHALALDSARLCGFVICEDCGVPFESATCPDCDDPTADRPCRFGHFDCSTEEGGDCSNETRADRPDLLGSGDLLTVEDDAPSPFGSALDD